MNKVGIAVIVLLLTWSGAAGSARAQYYNGMGRAASTENIEGFTVVGKGLVSAKPNLVEIDLEVSAASELTADAIVKYRDAKKRIHDAFAGLKLDNLAVEERGLLLDQKGMQTPYYFGGYQPNTRNKTEVQLSRKLIVKCSNVRKMEEDKLLQQIGKLLDVAQDAGAHVGKSNEYNPYYYDYYYNRNNQGLVRFVLDDFDKLQEEAYEKAVTDARTRAQRLAKLSGIELGPIVSVRELQVPGDQTPNQDDSNPTATKRLEASKFQEIPIRVELLVRFNVNTGQADKGRGDK